jgi:hypothetical protein
VGLLRDLVVVGARNGYWGLEKGYWGLEMRGKDSERGAGAGTEVLVG